MAELRLNANANKSRHSTPIRRPVYVPLSTFNPTPRSTRCPARNLPALASLGVNTSIKESKHYVHR